MNFGNTINAAQIGFCNSEKLGIYIANNFIIGFNSSIVQTNNVIVMHAMFRDFVIYEHVSEYLDFKLISKKIIAKLIDAIRYDITININIDKIIEEVIKNA